MNQISAILLLAPKKRGGNAEGDSTGERKSEREREEGRCLSLCELAVCAAVVLPVIGDGGEAAAAAAAAWHTVCPSALNLISTLATVACWYPPPLNYCCSHPVPPAHEDILAAAAAVAVLFFVLCLLSASYLLHVNVRSRLSLFLSLSLSLFRSPALLPPPPVIQLGRLLTLSLCTLLELSVDQPLCTFCSPPQFGSRQCSSASFVRWPSPSFAL